MSQMRHPFRQRRLAEILVERGFADRERLPEAGDDRELGERLLRESVVDPERLAQAFAEQFALPYVDLAGFTATARCSSGCPRRRLTRSAQCLTG